MELNELIQVFQRLLNNSWNDMALIAKKADEDFLLDDWKQANWELIVEYNLGCGHDVFLQPYEAGADYNGASSRILQPEALPTHVVRCYSERPLTDRLTDRRLVLPDEGLPFDCFVSVRDGCYTEEPPFDSVLLNLDEDEIVVGCEEVTFGIAPISSM